MRALAAATLLTLGCSADTYRHSTFESAQNIAANVILFLVIVAVGLYIRKKRLADQARADNIHIPLTWGVGGTTLGPLIEYDGEQFSEEFAREHAKTLSYLLAILYPQLVRDYDQYHEGTQDSFNNHGILIRGVRVTRNDIRHNGQRVDGRVALYPSGAAITLKAFRSDRDSGAWPHELRNVVRHYHARIPTGGAREFKPIVPGDLEAERTKKKRHRP